MGVVVMAAVAERRGGARRQRQAALNVQSKIRQSAVSEIGSLYSIRLTGDLRDRIKGYNDNNQGGLI
jgi:hypothetical protein